MADFAIHYVNVRGNMYAPGQRIDGLTDEEWKSLMAKKAIRCDTDAEEVVDQGIAELDDEPDAEHDDDFDDDPEEEVDYAPDDEPDEEPDDEDADEPEDTELTDAEMPDVSGADSVVSAPRRGRKKKEG